MERPGHRWFLGVALILLGLLAVNVKAATSDFDGAWRDYASTQTHLEPAYRFPHARCFSAAALQYDLPETLLLAVARGESDFEATARSRANAHGVMQILWPTTANHLGIYRLSQLYEPCANIDAGARYLGEMLGQFGGNIHLALAAYNYGPERIAKDTDNIPDGAAWYSGYILRHLNYVLGDGETPMPASYDLYSEFGRSTLLTFAEPYRAAAFVSGLEQNSPGLQLDWFRRGTGEFAVVLIYADKDEFNRSASLLQRAGFDLN